MRNFTTLENTPPDFLLCGTAARADYAADSFALGLCWFHLLSGKAPYEETCEALKCPAELIKALKQIWCAEGDGQYKPLRKLAAADEQDTLYHTLYRFICLFGLPAIELGVEEVEVFAGTGKADTTAHPHVSSSPAWLAVGRWLSSAAGRKIYARDCVMWCAYTGKAKPLAAAQRRMAALPGAEELLRGLTRFEPSRRWTTRRAMHSTLFDPYVTLSETAWARSKQRADDSPVYLHYMDMDTGSDRGVI